MRPCRQTGKRRRRARRAARLRLHPGTMLVPVDVVRAASGLDVETLWERIEAGRLRWVWDISTHPRRGGGASTAQIRELRFWVAELMAPKYCRDLRVEQALDCILGEQQRAWRTPEVTQWLLCSRSIVQRLVKAGELAGPVRRNTRWISRRSLTDFLRRRLVK